MKDYEIIYNYVKEQLYMGLNTEINPNVYGREKIMKQNAEMLEFIKSSEENQKYIIDSIIEAGLKEVEEYGYIKNAENFKKFINRTNAGRLAMEALSQNTDEAQIEKTR